MRKFICSQEEDEKKIKKSRGITEARSRARLRLVGFFLRDSQKWNVSEYKKKVFSARLLLDTELRFWCELQRAHGQWHKNVIELLSVANLKCIWRLMTLKK